MAGIAMLLAHGLFKAPLFLVTGIIDHATGTRDLRRLSGLWTSLRGSADHRRRGGGVDGRAAAAARLRRQGGRFRGVPRRGRPARPARHARAGRGLGVHRRLQRPVPVGRVRPQARGRRHSRCTGRVRCCPGRPGSARLGGLVLGIANPVVDADAQSYADAYPATSPEEAGYHLALWHGFGLPLLASAVALVLGYALHRGWSRAGRLAGSVPHALSAQRGYELAVSGTERVATVVTGRLQVGSVPTYLTVILAHRRRPARHGLAGRRFVAGPARLPRAAAAAPGRAGDARGARAGPGAPAVHRGAAGRGRRLRRRRAVHRRRCPRPRAGPVPRRDAVAGRVRLRPAPDARPVHPASGSGPGSRCPRP